MSSFSAKLFGVKRVSVFVQADPKQDLEFDASVSEKHSGDAQITDHPVEEGVDNSDHVRRLPEVLQMNAIVSNHPIVILRSINAKPSIKGGNPDTRAEDAYEFLRAAKNNGTFLGISTKLRDYANMVITSLGVSRDATTSNIVNLTLTFRELITATTETVQAPDVALGSEGREGKNKKGKKSKTAATAEESSLGFDIADSVGKFVQGL